MAMQRAGCGQRFSASAPPPQGPPLPTPSGEIDMAHMADQETQVRRSYYDDNGTYADNSFFVFHACDGAGVMQDCMGDIKYIEVSTVSYVFFAPARNSLNSAHADRNA